jgi:predicted RNA methylase
MKSEIARTLQGFMRSARHDGPFAAVAYVFDKIRVDRSESKERFDDRFGTVTEGKMYPWQLALKETPGAIHPYEATPAWLVKKILRSLPIDGREFTFIDLGSGMGRVLLLASEFSFPKIVGIEFARELSEIAGANVQRYRSAATAKSTFDLRCMDAAKYEFESDPLVVYLNNPFGKDTFDVVLSRLERSFRACPRSIFVVYLNPRFERRLKRSQVFRRLQGDGSRLRPWRHFVVYCSFPSRSQL